MATDATRRADAPGDPMRSAASPREAVDVALNRILCELALAAAPADPVVGQVAHERADLVELVRGLAAPTLEPLLGAVAAARNLDQLELALTTFSEAWTAWSVHGERAPEQAGGLPDPRHLAAASAESADTSAARVRIDQDVDALRGDPEMAGMFIGEALDHLGTIEASILLLEAAPGDAKILNDIFRPFHTVKGNASALGVNTVQELAHKVENLLDLCRSGRRAFGPAETDAALEAVDVLSAMVVDIRARLAGEPGADVEPRRRALIALVDGLVTCTSAAPPPDAGAVRRVEDPMQLDPRPARAAETGPVVIRSRRGDDGVGPASVKVDTRKLDNLVDMVGELVIVQAMLQDNPALLKAADDRLTRNIAQLRRITSELQRTAMSMRMVPIRQTFQKMARLVRDLSRKSGKSVDLVLAGEETELDRKVVEDINDPLMHMVRNSVDHGIEDAAHRAQSGKRPEGRLSLSAYHQGGNIVIAIRDDGAGLNTDRILAKALSLGLVQPGETLTPPEIHQLIFRPGFSTAPTITEISGRGVGMDVVRRNIDALQGRIEIQSTPGVGTTFLIKLPLTLAILDGLVLGVGRERFVMPTFSVRESLRPTPEQVHTVKGRPCMIQLRNRLVPLLRLADLYAIQVQESEICASTVVVIEDDGHQVGLVVDRLLGKQEIVIKSLGEMFGQTAGIAGGAILGDGRVGLILDAHGLVECTRRNTTRAA